MRKYFDLKSRVKKVAIVGGTHGNELAGIHLVKWFQERIQQNGMKSISTSFDILPLVSNPKAAQHCRRYMDMDLNRCFSLDVLNKSLHTKNKQELPWESRHALEVNKILGPKYGSKLEGSDEVKEPNVDFILDLHNSTANTGILLCFHRDDEFSREIYAYLHNKYPRYVRGSYWQGGDVPFLPSVGKSGLTLEVGPVAHGTIHAETLQRTRRIIFDVLEYIDARNQMEKEETNEIFEWKRETLTKVPIYVRQRVIDFPRHKDGSISAYVHPNIQGLKELDDASVLTQGSKLFVDIEGKEIDLDIAKHALPIDGKPLEIEDNYYPMFINEAAYYEKGVSMFLAVRKDMNIEVLLKKRRRTTRSDSLKSNL